MVDEEFHDDDDFAKTLAQLDQQAAKKPRKDSNSQLSTSEKSQKLDTDNVKEEKEGKDEEKKGGSSSLASKLSSKMKTSTSPGKKDSNGNHVHNVEETKVRYHLLLVPLFLPFYFLAYILP